MMEEITIPTKTSDFAKEIADDIISIFEKFLESKGVQIPSTDRDGEDDEACIFGTEYQELETKITKLLQKRIDEITP